MVRSEPSIAPPAALQPSLPRHIPKLLQKKTKMAPISSTPSHSAASHSQLVTKEKTKMAPLSNTTAQSAASHSQLVTTGKKQSWRTEEALVSKVWDISPLDGGFCRRYARSKEKMSIESQRNLKNHT
jgi:hypothetical protein